LNDLPFGLDMSKTSLTLSFWFIAQMLLALKCGERAPSSRCQHGRLTSGSGRPY
jgi:hypothetical protein